MRHVRTFFPTMRAPRQRTLGTWVAIPTLFCLAATAATAQTHGTWSPVSIVGSPSQTGAPTPVYDPIAHRKLLMAGDACNWFCHSNAVSALDLATGAWSTLAVEGSPPVRFLPNVAFDTNRNRALMFGGSYTSDSELWELSFGSGTPAWSTIELFYDSPPVARHGALTAYDAANDRLLLYGGESNGAPVSAPNEVLVADFVWETWGTMTTSGTPPASNRLPRGIHDPANDRFVMVIDGQTWQLGSLSTMPTWTRFPIPEPAPSGQPVFDTVQNRMIIVQSATQVWKLDLANPLGGWTLMAVDGPTPSGTDARIFDPVANRIVGERFKHTRFGIPHQTWALNLHPAAPASVPAAATAFVLEAPRPNPTSGPFACAFTLPSAAPACLDVFDVSGRRVLGREVGALGPGSHRVDLALGRRLPAGVYSIVLTQTGRRCGSRVVVSR